MVPITIGVPVYNGAALLDESLACLARQTFGDFNVLILDNASTDGTEQVARAWSARDSRFAYLRQSANVGVVPNFRDVLLAAESPWFLWRADDDLSADDYVEKLYRLATASPGCKLAVSTIVSCDLDGGRRSVWPLRPALQAPSLTGRLKMLFDYHPSWFYGLWDRETARNACLPISSRFPYAGGWDDLMLYGPVIDGAVRATTETEFVQRIRRVAGTERPKAKFTAAQLLDIRRTFRRELRRIRSERTLSAPLAAALVAIEPLYLHRRLQSLSKIARTRLRELLGVSGARSKPRHSEGGA